MKAFILDTNVFFSMQQGFNLGQTTMEVFSTLFSYAQKGREKNAFGFYMTPESVKELLTFFTSEEDIQKANSFLGCVQVVSPKIQELTLPARVFDELVKDTRARFLKAMQVAEDVITQTARGFMGKEVLPQIELQKALGNYITPFRERYRNATRTGFLDSAADIEQLLLARELNGALLTADEGLLAWARKVGVEECLPSAFVPQLHFLLGE